MKTKDAMAWEVRAKAAEAEVERLTRERDACSDDAVRYAAEVVDVEAERDRLAAALAEVREAVVHERAVERSPAMHSEWRAAQGLTDAAIAATPADLATARDARVRAEALREAADALDRGEYGRYPGTVYDWLRAEADRIGGGR